MDDELWNGLTGQETVFSLRKLGLEFFLCTRITKHLYLCV